MRSRKSGFKKVRAIWALHNKIDNQTKVKQEKKKGWF